MTDAPGSLYIVATPIGNFGDISQRAVEVLERADLVAAEDTRHSLKLLNHLGIQAKLRSVHEHNEREIAPRLLALMDEGQDIALISDAGTPLISDPGYHLVAQARNAGLKVIPIPGPSALIAALSVCGLPTDRFTFEGFLPHKSAARRAVLEKLVGETRTLVFYESSHRIEKSLADMAEVLGVDREATLARELTKRFETIHQGSLSELVLWLQDDDQQQKGEFVVVVKGAQESIRTSADEVDRLLRILMEELPLKQAAGLAAKLTGDKKNRLYQRALELRE